MDPLHKDRTLDLMTVSVTTNTAFNLANRMEEDFYTTFPIFDKPDLVGRLIRIITPEHDLVQEELDADQGPSDTVNHPAREVLSWFSMPALDQIMVYWVPIVPKGGIPRMKPLDEVIQL